MKPGSLTSLTILSAFCLTVPSLLADETSGDFLYTNSSKGITITDFTDSSATSVVIPPQIAGTPVTRIGEGAFYNRQNLTNVTIPESVTHIDGEAFFNCIGLMDLSFPKGLTTMGYGAFTNCESLLSITLPSGLKSLGTGAFQSCRRLRSVSLPPGITMIAPYSFSDCLSLTKLTIPDGVERIGERAFRGCEELETVIIPRSVRTIDDYGFEGCFKLQNPSLPEGIRKIGNNAFESCQSFTSVIIPASVEKIEIGAFSECPKLSKAIFLGDAPASIRTNAFYSVAPDFTVYHLEGKSGFTTPKWLGYSSEVTTLAPEIEVRQPTGTPLVDGTAKKSFGAVAVDSAKREKIFTITNNGTAELTGLAVTINGANSKDFKITTPAKTALAINGTTTFKVTFMPTGTGTREAEIHIKGKETGENPFDIRLAGMGVK
ncbi:MAG: leucine-rich repeat protein [Luteolibacter sp.]|uniref:leucine-rich repeat protein n=1 Tax=Luteolibacter sp. TaxID=1962973 RepID=UPI0032640BB7